MYCDESNKKTYTDVAYSELYNSSIILVQNACKIFEQYITFEASASVKSIADEILLNIVPFLINTGVDSIPLTAQASGLIGNAATEAWKRIQTTQVKLPNDEQWNLFVQRGDAVLSAFKASVSLCPNDAQNNIVRYTNMITIQKEILYSVSWKVLPNKNYQKSLFFPDDIKKIKIDQIMEWHRKIKELDPNYNIPPRPPMNKGCYVATCVYGSYDCPEVWTLRRYRDEYLSESFWGRCFIKLYYLISPRVVKMFGKATWFHRICRRRLDKFVASLRSKGYESTPYKD